jgi:hypothetical protein
MSTPDKEIQKKKRENSFKSKYQKHLSTKKVVWFSIAIFGVCLYFDEVLREEVKDAIWIILY